jgi:hypothetical protein
MQLIKGLDIQPFVKIQYASEAAKAEYSEKIRLASQCYFQLERETVKAGLRRCTTTHAAPGNMNQLSRELARQGLVFLPYKKVGVYSGMAHAHPPVVEGQPWSYYGPIAARIEDAELFCSSEDAGDHETIADLLGYPKCCRTFFRETWCNQQIIDPVWQAAAAAAGTVDGLHVDMGPSRAFTGLRYIGVRIAPHLPCSFSCKPSLELVKSWMGLAYSLEIPGRGELEELVTMPLEWDCFKGVATVTTKHFRVTTNSNPCADRHTLRIA